MPPPVTLNALASERMWPYPWRLPRIAIPLRCRCHRTPSSLGQLAWSSLRDEHATWVDRKEIDRHSDGLPQCLDFLLYAVYAPFLEELYLVRTVFAEEQGGRVSLAMDAAAESNALSSPLGLPIASLLLSDGVRGGGLDEAHVALLMETVDQWPPILVWGDEQQVIDGAHRVEAARRLGYSRVMAVRFVGSRDEAFIESVRRNVDHGLPLSFSDRRRAALRVLRRHPDWSDRRIASVCGLSGRTVARLRRDETGPSDGDATVVGLERRVGRDGKARPVQAGEVRGRIREALEENPAGSLRTIAAMAGASPETVRTVRAHLTDGGQPDAPLHSVPSLSLPSLSVTRSSVARSPESVGGPARPSHEDGAVPLSDGRRGPWVADSALLACGDGGMFARWFAANKVEGDWHQYVWTIPLGRVYDVVDEARRRAATWTTFASVLESRTR